MKGSRMVFNRFFSKRFLLLITGIILVLTISLNISGCSGIYSGGYYNQNTRYYTGYNSLDLQFMQDSPPVMMYYDSTSNQNEIPIIIQIRNMGASDAFGALYISGYDPHIMEVAGGRRATGSSIYTGGSGTSFSFGISSNTYVGLANNGCSNTQGGVAFTTQTGGYRYGASVFCNGVSRGFSFSVNPSDVGYNLAQPLMSMYYSNNYQFNSLIALPGNSPNYPGGGLEVYDFPTYIYYLPPSLDQFTQPIMVTACFSYATHASVMVCVDPRPSSNTKKICIPQTVSGGGGQGAPVAITAVEEHSSTARTVFTIHVHHSRQNALDDVYDLNSLYKCDPEAGQMVKSTDKNVVYINYIALSSTVITQNCVPANHVIRLDDSGNGEISCSVNFDAVTMSSGAYEAPLEVELAYGYSKNIYRDIIIKRI